MPEVLEKTAPAVDIPSVTKPFVAKGNSVLINDRAIIKHVGNVTIVNSMVRGTLTAKQHEAFDDIMFDLRTMGRPVRRLDSFSEYFDGRKQFDKLIANPSQAPALAQSIGLEFSADDLTIINGFNALRDKVTAFFKGLGPSYEFAAKTGSESELTYTEGNSRISNGSGHHISRKQFENVWKRCYKQWAQGERDNGKGTITEGGYSYGNRRTITVTDQRVTIGCQSATRWQVERMAVRLGLLEE